MPPIGKPGAGPMPGPSTLNMPKSPVGGPSGPGASPMVSPGGGEGMQALGRDQFRKIISDILLSMKHYVGQPESPEFKAAARALTALTSVFGKAQPGGDGGGGVPKPPMPVGNAAPVGPGGPPPMRPPGAMGMGAPGGMA
jgi:hypothetical protein